MKLPTPRKRGDAYRIEIMIDGKRTDLDYQRMIARDYSWLTSMRVVDITAQDLTRYRDMRLQKVAPSTVLRDFSYLSSVFSYAVKNLFIIDKNPCLDVHKPSKNKDRYRRITQDEIDALLIACDYQVGQMLNVYYNPTADELYDAMYGDK